MLIQEDVSLAPLTTLGVGGQARYFVQAEDEEAVIQAVRHVDSNIARRGDLLVLGGGSNLLVADQGFPGWVVALRTRGIREAGQHPVIVEAAAGEAWDDLVSWTVERELSGLECLAGVPGTVGATPIQNVGAYGKEVADTLLDLRAWDRERCASVTLSAVDCGFGYRGSVFKHEMRHRYVILSVRFALRRGPPSRPRQGELARLLDGLEGTPTPAAVRDIVLQLRRSKGMVYDAADPDTWSAGSFFVNPVVSTEQAQHIEDTVSDGTSMPRYPAGDGKVKLAAAWLIERAGFPRGYRLGAVGLSTRHCLALTNRGGASAGEVLELARTIRHGVEQRFGVSLRPEPVFVNLEL